MATQRRCKVGKEFMPAPKGRGRPAHTCRKHGYLTVAERREAIAARKAAKVAATA